MDERDTAISAIRKKLVGKRLNYKEIYAIMDQIAGQKFGNILTTYFAASGFSKGFNEKELYYLTRAMVETGEKLQFGGIVADKHSIGGVPGTRTTLIVVPIIATCGFTIPKSSSRAITTPSGTADDMEILAPVKLSKEKIYEVVEKTNGCIVWGGSFKIAPADDAIIKVEEELLFESFDKILVSILAKKVAFGSTHIVIDLPYGENVKVHRLSDAQFLANKFERLGRKFKMKVRVVIEKTPQPAGRGIGPILEVLDALSVLEQKKDRPMDLEERSLNLSANLLDICIQDAGSEAKKFFKDNFKDTRDWAAQVLKKGYALSKMKEIIKEQGGNPNVGSGDLKPGRYSFKIKSKTKGKISSYHIKNLTVITRILGAPDMKEAGIYLNKKAGESVDIEDVICTLYSGKVYNLKEGIDSLDNLNLFKLE